MGGLCIIGCYVLHPHCGKDIKYFQQCLVVTILLIRVHVHTYYTRPRRKQVNYVRECSYHTHYLEFKQFAMNKME